MHMVGPTLGGGSGSKQQSALEHTGHATALLWSQQAFQRPNYSKGMSNDVRAIWLCLASVHAFITAAVSWDRFEFAKIRLLEQQ